MEPIVQNARSLYVRRDVLNADELIAWAQASCFEAIKSAEKLHVTLMFSRDLVDWSRVPRDAQSAGTLTVPPDGTRSLARFGTACVLEFDSPPLVARHFALRAAGAVWDHEGYRPHVTITYESAALDLSAVQPYTAPIALGPEIFEEVPAKYR
jgi:uncharacterized protein